MISLLNPEVEVTITIILCRAFADRAIGFTERFLEKHLHLPNYDEMCAYLTETARWN